MSALGHKQKSAPKPTMSALPRKRTSRRCTLMSALGQQQTLARRIGDTRVADRDGPFPYATACRRRGSRTGPIDAPARPEKYLGDAANPVSAHRPHRLQLSALVRAHAATNHRGGTVIRFISCAAKDSVDTDDQTTRFDHARDIRPPLPRILPCAPCRNAETASDPARESRTSRSKLRCRSA